MKTVGVLIPYFTIEYSLELLSGIADFFRDKDVRVIIANTKIPGKNDGVYDYQQATAFEYFKSDEVDAIILASGVYCSSLEQDVFREIVEKFDPKPIISTGINLKFKNSYTILADCKKSYKQIIEHLKKEHGCKKIAFCSANCTKSNEALERYDAFTSALDSNHLPFYPDLVFDGAFTDFKAYDEIKNRYAKKADVDFDAIVCANDMMATGCSRALLDLGVRIPEDVKVIGFDDSIAATTFYPRLSTINQDIYHQGYEAAEIAMQVLTGEKVKKEYYTPIITKFRQSCGCIDLHNSQNIYKNVDNEICSDNHNIENVLEFAREMNEKNKIVTLMDTVRGSNTLKQLYYKLRFIVEQCDMSGLSINFFKDILFNDAEDEFILPNKMEMYMFSDREQNVELFRPEVQFDPHEKLFPARSMKDTAGIFILNPIFSGETNYGYVMCKIKENKFADYYLYIKIIITTIAQAYEYTSKIQETQKLESENSELGRQSRTDELTGILNRRGFIEKGQSALDVLQETDMSGIIFFADMDGLKRINDTYGHQMGDKAIKLQAKALKSVFRNTDVVGRLSGDEFGVVAMGMRMSYLENTRLKLNMMNEKLSKENNLPFTLSISIGAVDLEKSSSLKKLLSEADKSLYEEKRRKHAAIS